jgi:hypothetical protein
MTLFSDKTTENVGGIHQERIMTCIYSKFALMMTNLKNTRYLGGKTVQAHYVLLSYNIHVRTIKKMIN